MEKLKIQIHPLFVVFSCLLLYFGKFHLFSSYLIAIVLHELAHLFVARKLGYKINNIKLIPFGICLNINSNSILPTDEVKIAIAGPLLNLVLGFLTLAFWWIFPEIYNWTNIFCYANFVTCLFNLIPAFPLDGGRVVLALLKQKFEIKKATKIAKIFNIIITFLLFFMFVFSCFYSINLTYLLVIFCINTGFSSKNSSLQYRIINFLDNKNKYSKVLKVKNICVVESMPLYKICRHLDNFSYLQISVLNSDKKIIGVLGEYEFFKILENSNFQTQIGSVFVSKCVF